MQSDPKPADAPKEKRSSFYVVFATRDLMEDTDPLDADWRGVGTYEVEGNGGQRDARRQALNDPANKALKDAVLDGETVWFFCEPRNSFQPTPARLDAPAEPKIIL